MTEFAVMNWPFPRRNLIGETFVLGCEDKYLLDLTKFPEIMVLDAPLSNNVKIGLLSGDLPLTKFLSSSFISTSSEPE